MSCFLDKDNRLRRSFVCLEEEDHRECFRVIGVNKLFLHTQEHLRAAMDSEYLDLPTTSSYKNLHFDNDQIGIDRANLKHSSAWMQFDEEEYCTFWSGPKFQLEPQEQDQAMSYGNLWGEFNGAEASEQEFRGMLGDQEKLGEVEREERQSERNTQLQKMVDKKVIVERQVKETVAAEVSESAGEKGAGAVVGGDEMIKTPEKDASMKSSPSGTPNEDMNVEEEENDGRKVAE